MKPPWDIYWSGNGIVIIATAAAAALLQEEGRRGILMFVKHHIMALWLYLLTIDIRNVDMENIYSFSYLWSIFLGLLPAKPISQI